mgnify:CR=1 FL=1
MAKTKTQETEASTPKAEASINLDNINTDISPNPTEEVEELNEMATDGTADSIDDTGSRIQMEEFDFLQSVESSISNLKSLDSNSEDNTEIDEGQVIESLKNDKSGRTFVTVLDCNYLIKATHKAENFLETLKDFIAKSDRKFPIVLLIPPDERSTSRRIITEVFSKMPKLKEHVKIASSPKNAVKSVLSLVKSKDAIMSLNVFSNNKELNIDMIENFGLAKTNTASSDLYAGASGSDSRSSSMCQISIAELYRFFNFDGWNRIIPHVKLSNIKRGAVSTSFNNMSGNIGLDPKKRVASRLEAEIKRQQPLAGPRPYFQSHNRTPHFWENFSDSIYLMGNLSSAIAKLAATTVLFFYNEPWSFNVSDLGAGTAKTISSVLSTIAKHKGVNVSWQKKTIEHMQKMYLALLRENLSNKQALDLAIWDTVIQSAAMEVNFSKLSKDSQNKMFYSLCASVIPYLFLIGSVGYGIASNMRKDLEEGTLQEYLTKKGDIDLWTNIISTLSRFAVFLTSGYNLRTDVVSRKKARLIGEANATDDLDIFSWSDKIKFYSRVGKGYLNNLSLDGGFKKKVEVVLAADYGGLDYKKKTHIKNGLGSVAEKKGMIYIDAASLFLKGVQNAKGEQLNPIRPGIRRYLANLPEGYDVKIIWDKNFDKSDILNALLTDLDDQGRFEIVDLDTYADRTHELEIDESRDSKLICSMIDDISKKNTYYRNYVYMGENQEDINLFRGLHAYGHSSIAISPEKQNSRDEEKIITNDANNSPSINPKVRPAHFIGSSYKEVFKFFDKSNEKSKFFNLDYLKKVADKRIGRAGDYSLSFPSNAINLSGLYAPRTSMNIVDLTSFKMGFDKSFFNELKELVLRLKPSLAGKKEEAFTDNLFLIVVDNDKTARDYQKLIDSEGIDKNAHLSHKIKFVSREDFYKSDLKVKICQLFPNGIYNFFRIFNNNESDTKRLLTLGTSKNVTTIGTKENKMSYSKIESLTDALKVIETNPSEYDNAYASNVISRVEALRDLPLGAKAVDQHGKLIEKASDVKNEVLVSAPQITDMTFRGLTTITNAIASVVPLITPVTSAVASLGATASGSLNYIFKGIKEKDEIKEIAKMIVDKVLDRSFKNGHGMEDSIKIANMTLLTAISSIGDSIGNKSKEKISGISSITSSLFGACFLACSTAYQYIKTKNLFGEGFESFGLEGNEYGDIKNKSLPFHRPENSSSTDLYGSDIKDYIDENGKEMIRFTTATLFLAGTVCTAVGQLAQLYFNTKNTARLEEFKDFMKRYIDSDEFENLIEDNSKKVRDAENKEGVHHESTGEHHSSTLSKESLSGATQSGSREDYNQPSTSQEIEDQDLTSSIGRDDNLDLDSESSIFNNNGVRQIHEVEAGVHPEPLAKEATLEQEANRASETFSKKKKTILKLKIDNEKSKSKMGAFTSPLNESERLTHKTSTKESNPKNLRKGSRRTQYK